MDLRRGDTLRLAIEGEPGQIDAREFSRALEEFVQVLERVGGCLTPREHPVHWRLERVAMGSIGVDVVPVLSDGGVDAPAALESVLATVFAGFEELRREPRIPQGFDVRAVEVTKKLAARAGRGGLRSVTVVRPRTRQSTPLDPLVRDNAAAAVTATRESIGSVVGRLTMINVKGKPHFTVQDERAARPVRCNFEYKDIEQVKAGLGRRVVAFGLLRRNKAGQVVRVDMRRLRVFPDDSALPTPDDLAGADPEYGGGLSSVEYIRQVRG